MIDSLKVINYLHVNKQRLIKEYHLTKIGVFGSVAKNEQNKSSDIDIIVEFENNTLDLFNLKENLRSEIMNEFSVNVDICREKYIKPVFKDQIMSEVKYV